LETLIEANAPQVGSWTFELTPVPTGVDLQGKVHRFPALQITAFTQETKKTRKVIISGDVFSDASRRGAGYRKAFENLFINFSHSCNLPSNSMPRLG
jgi:hypothetical protein